MTEEKLVQFWAGEIARGQKVLDYWKPCWQKCRQAYRNHFYRNDGSKTKEVIERPLFFANVKTLVSSLVANDPTIMVTPQRDEFTFDAIFTQAALKYDFERLDIFKKLFYATMDMAIYNPTIMKVGYNFTETFNMKGDSAFVSRVSQLNYMQEPEAVTQEDAPWELEKKYMNISDLLKGTEDEGYLTHNFDKAKELARQQITNKELTEIYDGDSGDPLRAETHNNARQAYPNIPPSKVKKLLYYEIYDKVNRKIIWIAEGKVLIRYYDFPEYMENSPYVTEMFNRTPEYFHGEPDYLVHETQYAEINRIINRLSEHTRKLLYKVLINQNAIKGGASKIDKISKGEFCELIPVDTSLPLDQIVKSIFNEGINPANFQVLMEIKAEIDQDTGIADFMRGANSGKGTATQASMAASGAASRATERLRIVENIAENVARKLFLIRKHMMTAEQWIGTEGIYPVLDPISRLIKMQQLKGFMATPDMLQADLRIKIEAGSTAVNNYFQKQQSALNFYSVMAQNPNANQIYLTKYVSRHYDGIDIDELLKPNQQQIQQPPQGANPMSQPGANQTGVNPSAMPSANQTEGDVMKNLMDQNASGGNKNVY